MKSGGNFCVQKLRWKFCHDLANVFDTLLVWAGIVAGLKNLRGLGKFSGSNIGESAQKLFIMNYIYVIKYKHETKPVSFHF